MNWIDCASGNYGVQRVVRRFDNDKHLTTVRTFGHRNEPQVLVTRKSDKSRLVPSDAIEWIWQHLATIEAESGR
jgi:hypothetical protein